jgi:hypothetical protein
LGELPWILLPFSSVLAVWNILESVVGKVTLRRKGKRQASMSQCYGKRPLPQVHLSDRKTSFACMQVHRFESWVYVFCLRPPVPFWARRYLHSFFFLLNKSQLAGRL